MSLVLLGDYDEAMVWIDIAATDDRQKALLRRFVAVEAGTNVDGELAADMSQYFWNRPDYPIAIWMWSQLGANQEMLSLLTSRLDRGRLIEFRPLWGPGVDLSREPGFTDFLERSKLIDYWETSGWGDVCVLQKSEIQCNAPQLTPENLRSILSGTVDR